MLSNLTKQNSNKLQPLCGPDLKPHHVAAPRHHQHSVCQPRAASPRPILLSALAEVQTMQVKLLRGQTLTVNLTSRPKKVVGRGLRRSLRSQCTTERRAGRTHDMDERATP
ncbi:unnamed protein product [Arctia plantaginis]|uniref:Uncharacterized protein n=1 Tax=Arctia plantaginis TaxID=874455 RepID=A0A8S1BTN5_ARCPL|nr:unnamed protein product [Arctia plantaginis]